MSTAVSNIVVQARVAGESSDNWLVYLLFIVAGFLIGGTWAAWQAKKIVLVVITGLLAVAACGVALTWLIGEMT